MACGLGLMFGIRLPINFFSPYKSSSIIEFWRRWHMTLSRFLRDYIYIALGGNRKGPLRRWHNLLITMTLGGLWHGAGWTFVLWGTYHGFLLMINHSWRSVSARLAWCRVPKPLAITLTSIFVLFGWVMFKSSDIHSAIIMFESLFDVNSVALAGLFAPAFSEWMRLIAALCSVWIIPNSYQIFAAANPALGDIVESKVIKSLRVPVQYFIL
jgi:alginate O-acetyltransferase complex protein AlgI